MKHSRPGLNYTFTNDYNNFMYVKRLTVLSAVNSKNQQDAQLSQRDHAAGCVIVFAKSRRLELGDNILRTL